jgi:hypothetical protein
MANILVPISASNSPAVWRDKNGFDVTADVLNRCVRREII